MEKQNLPYIEYNPETQVYCAGCRSVVNKAGRHLCPQSWGAPDQHYGHIVTLRDQFAMAALPCCWDLYTRLPVGGVPDSESAGKFVASEAYAMADAMLEARKVKP